MSQDTVFVKKYTGREERLAQIDRREVWRYAGYPGGPPACDAALNAELDRLLEECRGIFRYDVCWLRIPLLWENGKPILPLRAEGMVPNPGSGSDTPKGSDAPKGIDTPKGSDAPKGYRTLKKHLDGCGEAVLFAATIGLELDRRIARYERLHPTRALLLQALGAERVEALCDTFCAEFSAQRRCSPGYGDFPLSCQRDFVNLLDTSRKIGLSLNDSLLMSPSKSVTAVFGLTPCTSADSTPAGSTPAGSTPADTTPVTGTSADSTSACSTCTARGCLYRKAEAST